MKKKELCIVEASRWFQTRFNEKENDYFFNQLENADKAHTILLEFYEHHNPNEYKRKQFFSVIDKIYPLFIKRNKLYLYHR